MIELGRVTIPSEYGETTLIHLRCRKTASGMEIVGGEDDRPFDAATFRYLRDEMGARIVSENPETLFKLLGLSPEEEGLLIR